jgi:hypothetical protein
MRKTAGIQEHPWYTGSSAMNEKDELRNVVRAIPDFKSWDRSKKIQLCAWFIRRFHEKEEFTAQDIRRCFRLLDMHDDYVPLIPRSANIINTRTGYHLRWETFEALDKKYCKSHTAKQVHHVLEELPNKIVFAEEKNYLEETLTCYSHGAFRAAIVMCWNLVFSHLCNFILNDPNRLASFNQKLSQVYPKANQITKYDDFQRLKESHVLEICNASNLTTKTQSRILQQKLDRRNDVAHPSSINIQQLNVEEYILDLATNVLLKLV